MNEPARPRPATDRHGAWGPILELAFEGLAVLEDNHVVGANGPFAALFGLEPAALIGQNLGGRLAPRDALRALTGLEAGRVVAAQAMRADGMPLGVELRRKPLGGGLDLVAIRELDDARRVSLAVEELAAQVAPFTGQAYFESLVGYLARVCQVDMAVIWELRQPQDQVFHQLAGQAFGAALDTQTAARAGSPCGDVVAHGARIYAQGVREAYPDCATLAAWRVAAYIGVPLHDQDGRPLGVLALLHARPLQGISHIETLLAIVAPRAAAELSHLRDAAALKASKARYRQLVEHAADMVLRLDRHGRCLYANPAAEGVAGVPLAQLVGRTYREAGIPEDLCVRADAHLARVLGGEALVTMTFELSTPEGPRHFEFRMTPERDAAGAVETVHAVGRDITELKGLATRLRDREGQLATLIANLPGMAYRCRNDAQWTMSFVSEGCLELTGYAPEEFIGNRRMSFDQLYHPDDHDRIWAEVQAALAAQRPFELTYRIRDRAGRLKWVWEKGRGIFGDDGALLYLEGLLMDISERKRAEAELRAANAELTRLGVMKDEFLSTMSHELRTPLSTVQTAVAILLKQKAGPLNEDQRRFVAMIRDQGVSLQRLVDDILDYQQLSRGATPLLLVATDMRELVEAEAAAAAATFARHGSTLTLELPTEAVPCDVDRVQMAQVLRSLLSNAAKFTPPGGSVVVRVARAGPDVHLTVRDNGRGMPADALERIFEEFLQLDGSLTRTHGGAGLGLALCRQIVEQHGGRIWAESVLGQGTAMHVALLGGTGGALELAT